MPYSNNPIVGVGAVVFKDNRILLVKRGKPPSEGTWAIPGGCVNLGESLKNAAEREILEETSITIKAGEPVFVFDAIEKDEAGRIRFHYVIVDLMAEYISGDICPGDDAVDARWVSDEEIKTLNVNPVTLKLLSKKMWNDE